jgi:hypothetical protein
VADAEAIRQDIERENGSATQDNCSIPSSQITTFFN